MIIPFAIAIFFTALLGSIFNFMGLEIIKYAVEYSSSNYAIIYFLCGISIMVISLYVFYLFAIAVREMKNYILSLIKKRRKDTE